MSRRVKRICSCTFAQTLEAPLRFCRCCPELHFPIFLKLHSTAQHSTPQHSTAQHSRPPGWNSLSPLRVILPTVDRMIACSSPTHSMCSALPCSALLCNAMLSNAMVDRNASPLPPLGGGDPLPPSGGREGGGVSRRTVGVIRSRSTACVAFALWSGRSQAVRGP